MYVDDLIPISNDFIMLNNEVKIRQKFEMVNNGDISYWLGLVIKETKQDFINKPTKLSRKGVKNI